MRSARLCVSAPIAALAVSACTTPPLSQPQVPEQLRPPAGQVVFLEARGSGSQIYQCASAADGSYGWVFRAPEASLADRSGQAIGKHYAGPTWELKDGSVVVGQVKGTSPAPNAAIPWLLLSAKSTAGSGALGAVTSIQRVDTVGGITPAEGCAAGNAEQIVKVPYTATYYFYRAG